MSSHEGPIGQEWTEASWDSRHLGESVDALWAESPHAVRRMVAYLEGRWPMQTRDALLYVEHALERHAGGRCPEQCPRF